MTNISFKEDMEQVIKPKIEEQQITISDTSDMSALANSRLTKLKKQINAENWSDEMEDLMQSWGEKAAGSRELHDNAARYWKRFGDRIFLPIIILSAIGSVSNFGAASVQDPSYWMYCIGALNMLTAGLASVAQYYRPDEKSQNHHSVARNFGSFYRTMTVELGMSRAERMNSEDLIRWAKNEYDRVQWESPQIPSKVLEQFKKDHGSTKRNLPDIVNTLYDIKINNREKIDF